MTTDIQKDLAVVRAALRSVLSVTERHNAQDALYRISKELGEELAPANHPQLPLED